MVDFTDVLSRAIAGKKTYDERRVVYERARQALVNQLRALDPPLPESDVTRQRLALEESIRKTESEASSLAAAARAAALRRPSVGTAARPPMAPPPIETPIAPPPPVIAPVNSSPEPAIEPAPVSGPLPDLQRAAHVLERSAVAVDVQQSDVMARRPAPAKSPAADQALASRGQVSAGSSPRSDANSVSLNASVRQKPSGEDTFAEVGDRLTAPILARPPRPIVKEPIWRRGLMIFLIIVALAVAGVGGVILVLRGQGTNAVSEGDGASAPPLAPVNPPTKSSDRVGPADSALPLAPAAPSISAQTAALSAVLYDENGQSAGGVDAYKGTVTWRVDSDNGAHGPEQVIRGLVEIPNRGIKLLLTIRRNLDQALPASHTVELLFDVPANFEYGGIESLEQMFMKTGEQANGLPLRGALARITSGYFLIGLSALGPNRENNIALLRDRPWIDVTFLYRNGRRAVVAFGKGAQGEKIFQDTFAQWGG